MAKHTSIFSGPEIDSRLAAVDGKIGATYFDSTTMYLYQFADEEEKEAWLADPESITPKRTLFNFAGTMQQVKVINEMSSGTLYFTTKAPSAEVTCSFLSQEKGLTESNWTDINEDFEVSVEIDKGNTGAFITVVNNVSILNGSKFTFDIKNYIATGANRVRVKAVGKNSGASGAFVYNVTLTTMYLSPSNFTWYLPFVEGTPYVLGGMNIGGNLDKIIRIRVSREEVYTKEYEIPIGDTIYDSTAYTFTGLEFPTAGTGVYNVDIWLDANGLTSDHLNYNIICVAAEDATTAQLVSVSESPETVLNFAENKLFDYCIYNGGMTVGSPEISLDTIVNTNKTNLKTETLVDVPTGRALSYSTALEIEVVESKMQLSATMTYGNAQQVVYPIDNSKSFPATSETVFYLNPAQRSNSQVNKEQIVNSINSVHYNAEWSRMAWVEGVDGWTTDDQGRMCLRIPALSKCIIDYSPIADNRQPFTLEFVYKVSNASDYDEPIITIADDVLNADGSYNPAFKGLKITPKNVCLHSRNLTNSKTQDYNLIENSIVDIIITIVPNYKTNYGNLAQIYCNGVKVRSFEFTSINEWNTQGKIILGSNTADLFLYKMRFYRKGFNKTDATRNFINSLPDIVSREALYNKLTAVTDDSFNIDYDTCVKNGYNTMIIEMLNGKNIPSLQNQEEGLLCNLQINIHNIVEGELDEEMESLLTGTPILSQVIEGQGTTAMTYNRWNFRWKLDSLYGKRRITAKKNVASSMHSHKMGATRMFNYLHNVCVGANEVNGKVAVLQYPVFGFQKILQDDGKTYKYQPIGLYTVGADKGDKKTFGYNNKTYEGSTIHMEGADHTPKTVGFDYPWEHAKYSSKKDVEAMGAVQPDGNIVGAWEVGMAGEYETDSLADESNIQAMLDAEFKDAYNVAYHNSPFISGTTEDLTKVDPATWQEQVDIYGNSYKDLEFWDSKYDLYFYNQATKKYESTGINMLTDLGLTSAAVSGKTLEEINNIFIEKRCERFAREWGNHWHKDDSIFHYVFCLVFGATDNFKKNTYPYKFKLVTDGGKWRWRADDLDTIFDINNQGLAAKLYSILVGDKTDTGSGSIYRGDNSAFWTLIKITQQTAIKAMVHKMFDAMVAHPKAQGANTQEKLVGAVKYFFWNFAQEYFPETAYNVDTEWTYEDTWYDKNAWKEVNPLSQALGGHYEAERDWVTMRMLFCASYYNYGAFTATGYNDGSTGQMVYGGAGAHTYEFTPAIDMNPTIVRGSTETIAYGDRVKAGETVPLTVSSSAGADTRVYVQGLDWMKDIGDLSNLTVSADNPTLNIASKRLQRIKIGDEDATKIPSSATIQAITFGDCPSMTSIDARNLSTLTGTVDLIALPRLREAYFGGTDVKVLKLQDGSKIEKLQIPDSLTELRLKDLKFIENLEYNTVANISSFHIENCPTINGFNLLKTAYKQDKSLLSQIRLVGFNEDVSADDLSVLSNMVKDINYAGEHHVFTGINSVGEVTDHPVLEGTVNLSTPIYKEDEEILKNAYGNAFVINSDKGYYVKFADPEVQRVLLANGVGDGIGITTEDVEKVTSIGDWFRGNTIIETFDELEKFTGITKIGVGNYNTGFKGCSNLKHIKIPSTVTHIVSEAFDNTTLLESIGDTTNVTIIGTSGYGGGFRNSGVKVCNFPNLEKLLSIDCWKNSGVEEIISLGKVTSIQGHYQGGTFGGCTKLRKISQSVLNSLTSIGQLAFGDCTSLEIEDMALPNLKTINAEAFRGAKIKKWSNMGKLTTLPAVGYTGGQTLGDWETLEEIVLPDTLQVIGDYALYKYSNCKIKKIPASITSIGSLGFYSILLEVEEINLPNLTGTLPQQTFANKNITKIISLGNIVSTSGNYNSGPFAYCTKLTECVLPDTLVSIGKGFFHGCTSLSKINIPESVESIGDQSFSGCTSLYFEELNTPNLSSLGSGVFNGVKVKKWVNMGKLTTVNIYGSRFDQNTLEEVVIPVSATSIATEAFYSYKSLKQIDIPDNITTIGNNAFIGCTGLLSVNIGNGVKILPSKCFYQCTGLKEVVVGSNVNTISNECFYNCNSINSISLPNNISSIGDYAFQFAFNKDYNIEINLPNVSTVGIYCFSSAKASKIILMSLTGIVSHRAFSGSTAELIELGDGVTGFNGEVFSLCASLQTLILHSTTPPSLSGTNFYQNPNTMIIYVPDASVEAYRTTSGWSSYVNRILPYSDYVWQDTTSLVCKDAEVQRICLEKYDKDGDGSLSKGDITSVTTIGSDFTNNTVIETFDEFEMFTNVKLSGGYGSANFYGCKNLKSIVLPSHIKELPDQLFRDSGLVSVNLDNIEVIGIAAFMNTDLSGLILNLPRLKRMSGDSEFLGSNIKEITDLGTITELHSNSWANGPFYRCKKLERVTIPRSLQKMYVSEFRECASLYHVDLPDTLEQIGSQSFWGCTNLTTFICRAVTPPTGITTDTFGGGINSLSIYVPDDSVDAYKTSWSIYADKIKPLSTYTE